MKRVKIQIEGMTCPNCESHVEKELKILGAKDIKVSHENESAIFTVEENIGAETLNRVIKTAGYTPGKVFFKEVDKKGILGRLFK